MTPSFIKFDAIRIERKTVLFVPKPLQGALYINQQVLHTRILKSQPLFQS